MGGGQVSAVLDGSGGAIYALWTYNQQTGEQDIGAQRVDAEGNVLWGASGVVVCAAAGNQASPVIATDMAGGAIIAWNDLRSGSTRTYIQRIDSNGNALWAADGVAIECDSTSFYDPRIVSDGAGGAIVACIAYRSGSDILAQRFDASGNALWAAGGVPVCAAAGNQFGHRAAPDGAGGIIVCWLDRRVSSINDVYAQRIDGAGSERWTAGGVALYVSPAKEEFNPVIEEDGFGGAIVAWEDYRNGVAYDVTCDIYASRLDSLGNFLWGTSGSPVVVGSYRDEKNAGIVPDGSGGALFKFDASSSIWMQSLDAAGAQRWTTPLQVSPTGSNQANSVICGDGAGGAVAAWRDDRIGASKAGIYAQRVDTSKTCYWTAYGTPFIVESTSSAVNILGMGDGNAFIAWGRQTDSAVFVRRIEGEHGAGGFAEARVTGVSDVPADEGGLLRVALRASDLDNAAEPIYPISTYALWQRVDDPALLADLAASDSVRSGPEEKLGAAPAGCSLLTLAGKTYLSAAGPAATSMPPGSWELIASVPALQASEYLVRATTVTDSSAAGTPWSVYVATAHSTTASVWWTSAPDSGYSVDNLAPSQPSALAGEQSYDPAGLSLSWSANSERDLKCYAVYRGTSADFAPSAENRVGSPAEPSFFDTEWRWDAGYYYKVSAVDVHDNESPRAVLGPDGVTGVETPEAVRVTRLHQNVPNPFNPSTDIRFDLKERGVVSLRVYDASGRLIRELAGGERAAGRYVETWDGRDDAGRSVASGVYFCRLETGSHTSAKKMLLLR
ncbi:MAG: T9SS C-terminal target domain-containing protein [Candidatus Latescibacterota bacterium]|jgi:hypothetical protein|nr:MAG: T9SS C-terminal target domain-containing protein [Candidatus Latescibacterota bacterium]